MTDLKSYSNIQLDFGMTRHRVTIEARQGDKHTRYVRACAICHGAQLTLEGITARAEYKQANGKGSVVDCEVEPEGYVVLELTDLMLSVPGVMSVTMVLYKDGAFLTSQEFDVRVRPRLVGENTELPDVPGMSVHEALSKLQKATAEAEEILARLEGVDYFDEIEQAKTDVIGTEGDEASADTIHAAKNYATSLHTTAKGLITKSVNSAKVELIGTEDDEASADTLKAVRKYANNLHSQAKGLITQNTKDVKAECIAKNQGADNVGKILVVGTDGNLTLADMPEGGPSGDVVGVLDASNNILISGDLADGTYTLKYENTDGTYTEIGTLEVGAIPEPVAPVTENITLTDGIRVGSDGGDRAQAGCCATPHIDLTNIPKPCTIHLTGARWAFYDTAATGHIMYYATKADGSKLAGGYTTDSIGDGYFSLVRNGGGENETDVTVTVTSNEVATIRFGGVWTTVNPNTMQAKATLTYTPNA